ncbi:hypothetical protein JCM10207_003038 [Rhodosporidiobolus poonsookiae]
MLRYLVLAACASLACAADSDNVETDEPRNIAGFVPAKWISYAALGLFGLSGFIHWLHLFRNGHKYMLPLTLGMTGMCAGFAIRILYANSVDSLGLYIGMTMFILLSPCLFLAQDYMLLHRLADSLGEDVAKSCLLIRSSRITKIFVTSDVVTFFLQASGGGMSAASSEMAKWGPKIALFGLGVQLVCFLGFCVILGVFAIRVRKRFPHLAYPARPFRFSGYSAFSTDYVPDWRILVTVMAITCGGIIIRSIYRLAEYAEGRDGVLATKEAYFYLLDALPLWISMTLYAWLWPTRVINGVEEADDAGRMTGYPVADRHAPWTSRQGSGVGMSKMSRLNSDDSV